MNRRVRAVLRKEWEEVFKNGLVLFTMVFTPLLFVVMGVGTVAGTGMATRGAPPMSQAEAAELRKLAGEQCAGLDGAACLDLYLGTLMLLLFMMLPLILPTVFAAYSVVGEKTGRTLEPLLATPIRTTELLLAKVLAAAVPAVVVTWGGVACYLGGLALLGEGGTARALLSPAWLAAVGVLAPLLAVGGVLAAVIVSSRVNDPRTAQQLSGVVVMPLAMVLVGQSMGLFIVDAAMVGVAVVVMVVLDLVLAWVSVALFDRENVLTRWKGA